MQLLSADLAAASLSTECFSRQLGGSDGGAEKRWLLLRLKVGRANLSVGSIDRRSALF